MLRSRIHVAALAGGAVLAVGLPAAAQEAPGRPGRIAYSEVTADRSSAAIATVAPQGGAPTTLTSGAFDTDPTWSPDATQIAFTRVDLDPAGPGATAELWITAADGTGTRQLAVDGAAPDWSPDGRTLAYATTAGGIGVLDMASGRAQVFVEESAAYVDPAWSPDGTTLALVRLHEQEVTAGLVLFRPRAGEPGLLIPTPGLSPADVDWAPDGDQLAFSGLPEGTDAEADIHLIGADGAGLRRVTGDGVGSASQPRWSPDGLRLAYVASPPGRDDGLDVFVAELGSGESRTVGDAPTDDVDPTWSPDATELVYTAFDDIFDEGGASDLMAVDAGGGAPRPVTTSGHASGGDFSPGVTRRTAGPTRVETAVEIGALRPETASAVVLARADLYADALAGAPLAGQLDAPVLLTPGDRLHPSVAAEIGRLGAGTAYLLGGEGALSARMEADLAELGVAEVVRLDGANRYDTARQVAARLDSDEAFVVQGAAADPARGWPDAVAVSGVAAFTGRPILLTEADRLPAETLQALREGGIGTVRVVGGTAAVSQAVRDAIAAEGLAVSSIAGPTRYETSVKVATFGIGEGMDPARTWLATGRDWPDALAAGPGASADGGVLLLADGAALDRSPAAARFLQDQAAAIETVRLVGGTAALTPLLVTQVEFQVRSAPG